MAENQQPFDEAALRAQIATYVAPNPSPRNPQIDRHSSLADRIEDQLQSDGHRAWGYVIYRTTYESDADWTEFIRRLRYWNTDIMQFFNGQDILDLMAWTVFDDRSLFDGADTASIRRHFDLWARNAVVTEQPSPAGEGLSPRYKYCVQVDSEALKSALDAPAPPKSDIHNTGWVKVIQRKWRPTAERGRPQQEDEEQFEPLEGVTDESVGWVRCPFPGVMTECYVDFIDRNGFAVAYRRPPAVIGYPWA